MRDSIFLAIISSVETPPAVTTALSYPTWPSISISQFFRALAMLTRLTHTLVAARPLRSRVIMLGLQATKAGISSHGISFPRSILHFSFSRSLALRASLSMSDHNCFTLRVSSVSSTPLLRSRTTLTREPLLKALTALRLIWNPTGPSSPPSVKSTSPNSQPASQPSTSRRTPTFLR